MPEPVNITKPSPANGTPPLPTGGGGGYTPAQLALIILIVGATLALMLPSFLHQADKAEAHRARVEAQTQQLRAPLVRSCGEDMARIFDDKVEDLRRLNKNGGPRGRGKNAYDEEHVRRAYNEVYVACKTRAPRTATP